MLSCKEAGQLIEKKAESRISPWERLRLRSHLLMCKACDRYAQQSRIMNAFFQIYFGQQEPIQAAPTRAESREEVDPEALRAAVQNDIHKQQ